MHDVSAFELCNLYLTSFHQFNSQYTSILLLSSTSLIFMATVPYGVYISESSPTKLRFKLHVYGLILS